MSSSGVSKFRQTIKKPESSGSDDATQAIALGVKTNVDYQIVDVEIRFIDNNHNIRIERDIDELAADIQLNGLQTPLTIAPYPSSSVRSHNYRLITGHRRLLACKKLKWTTVPAFVKDGLVDANSEWDELKIVTLQYSENEARDDMSDIEKATIVGRLSEQFNLSERKLAGKLNLPKTNVRRSLEIFKAIPQLNSLFPLAVRDFESMLASQNKVVPRGTTLNNDIVGVVPRGTTPTIHDLSVTQLRVVTPVLDNKPLATKALAYFILGESTRNVSKYIEKQKAILGLKKTKKNVEVLKQIKTNLGDATKRIQTLTIKYPPLGDEEDEARLVKVFQDAIHTMAWELAKFLPLDKRINLVLNMSLDQDKASNKAIKSKSTETVPKEKRDNIYILSSSLLTFAKKQGISETILQEQRESFLDHYRKKDDLPGTQAGFESRFKSWLRRAKEMKIPLTDGKTSGHSAGKIGCAVCNGTGAIYKGEGPNKVPYYCECVPEDQR